MPAVVDDFLSQVDLQNIINTFNANVYGISKAADLQSGSEILLSYWNTFKTNVEGGAGIYYDTSPLQSINQYDEVLVEHFKQMEQVAQDYQNKRQCKGCSTVCTSSCSGGCSGSCSNSCTGT